MVAFLYQSLICSNFRLFLALKTILATSQTFEGAY